MITKIIKTCKVLVITSLLLMNINDAALVAQAENNRVQLRSVLGNQTLETYQGRKESRLNTEKVALGASTADPTILPVDSVVPETEQPSHETTQIPDSTLLPESPEPTDTSTILPIESSSPEIPDIEPTLKPTVNPNESTLPTTPEITTTAKPSVVPSSTPNQTLSPAVSHDSSLDSSRSIFRLNKMEEVVDTSDIIEKRTENSKTFDLGEGLYRVDIYPSPVHKEVDGEMVEINTNLEQGINPFSNETTKIVAQNSDVFYHVEFYSEQENLNQITNENGIKINTIVQDGNTSNFLTENETIQYFDVYPHVDFQYHILTTSLKENILLNEGFEGNELRYSLDIGELKPEMDDAGLIYFKDANGDTQFTYELPYLMDAAKEASFNVSLKYEQVTDTKIELIINWDDSWTQNENRVYPIIIDPVITPKNRSVELDVVSSYVRSTDGRAIQSKHMQVGFESRTQGPVLNTEWARSIIHFSMPNISAGYKILEAKMELYRVNGFVDHAGIDVYSTNSYLDPVNANYYNLPEKKKISSITAQSLLGTGYRQFDITSHVKDLYSGVDKTLILITQDEYDRSKGPNIFMTEGDINRPVMSLKYSVNQDVDPNIDPNLMFANLRIYSRGINAFYGVSVDGIAKPLYYGNISLYKINNKNEEVKLGKQFQQELNQLGTSFVDPIYISVPLVDTQRYEKEEVNFTTGYIFINDILEYETVYFFDMEITQDPSGRYGYYHTRTDQFLLHEVKLGETLPSLAAYYGVSINQILRDNNVDVSTLLEGQIIVIRIPSDTKRPNIDSFRPPVTISEYTAEYKYRGDVCLFACYAADPVNVGSGNYYHSNVDIKLKGFENIELKRYYNSSGEIMSSMFGNSFTTNFDQYTFYDKDKNLYYLTENGRIYKYLYNNGNYTTDLDNPFILNFINSRIVITEEKTNNKMYFDAYGVLERIVELNGQFIEPVYDEYGMIRKLNLSDTSEVIINYNNQNMVKEIILPDYSKVSYEYNLQRQLTKFTDTKGFTEVYSYDESGHIKEIIDENGDTLGRNKYDDRNRVVEQIDGENNATTFNYQEDKTIVTKDSNSVTYFVDEFDRVTKVEFSDGTSRENEYSDIENQLLYSKNELGSLTEYTYNEYGDINTLKEIDGKIKTYEKNEYGFPTKIIYYDGSYEEFTYDNKMNVLTHRNIHGKNESYSYNDNSQVVEHIDFYDGKTQMEYTGVNLTKATLPNGDIVKYEYDELNRLKKEIYKNYSIDYKTDKSGNILEKYYSSGKIEKWEYDGRSNVTKYTNPLGMITMSEYNSMNLPIKITKGNQSEYYTYNAEGRKTSYTDKFGKTEYYVYDIKGNVIETTDKFGSKTINTYDDASNLIKTVDALGNVIQYSYIDGLLISEINARNEKTKYEYDNLKRLVTTEFWNGQKITNEYNEQGLVFKVTDTKGIVTEYLYDQNGNQTKITTNGNSEFKQFDANGNIISEIDKNGLTIQHEYDMNGNEIKTKYQDGSEIVRVFDLHNNLISETNQLGFTKTMEYDLVGNLLKQTDSLGNSEINTYNNLSQLIEKKDKEGYVTTFEYNELGLLIKEVSPRDFITTYEYDEYGREIKKITDGIVVESKVYDQVGRIIETSDLKEHYKLKLNQFGQEINKTNMNTLLEIANEYDVHGNIIKTTNSAGQINTNTYDIYNRLKSATNSLLQAVTYEYDVFDNVVKETKGERVIKQTYSPSGNLIVKDDSGIVTTYEYDLYGNLIQSKVNNKLVEKKEYDALSQIVKTYDALGYEASSIYDGEGQLLQEIDKNGNVTLHEYDKNGNETKVTDALGNSFSYRYDSNGNIIETVDPAGNKKTSVYNAFAQPLQELDERNFLTEYIYNSKQQLITKKLPYSYQVHMTYDKLGNINSISDTRGNISFSEYDLLGNLIKEKNNNGAETVYRYNLEGQLIEVTYPNTLHVSYEYDLHGNLVKLIQDGHVMETNTYDIQNRITTKKNALNNSVLYSYDDQGNIIQLIDGNLTTKNEYNANNQLIKSTLNNDKVFEYTYDKNGNQTILKQNNRIIKTTNYDGNNNIINEFTKGVKKYYIYNSLGKVKEEGFTNGSQQDVLYSYEYDSSSNIIKQTDNANRSKLFSYDAFNNKIEEIDSNGNSTRFNYDGEGNLIKLEDAEKRVVNYSYDKLNQLIKKSYSLTQEATYTYNTMGNMISSHDEYGINLSMEYNLLGYKTKLVKGDKSIINYEYDLTGNLLKESSGNIELVYSYDSHGNQLSSKMGTDNDTRVYDKFDRLVKVVDTNGFFIEYEYDLFDNQTIVKTTDTSIQTYADEPTGPIVNVQQSVYNDNNQLIEILNGDTNTVSTKALYEYDSYGHVSKLIEQGITVNSQYDIYNQLLNKTTKEDNKVIHDLAYTYDGEGNVLTEKIKTSYDLNSGSCKEEYTNIYTYDKMNQLKTSIKKDYSGKMITTTYTYNLYGNPVTQSSEGNTTYIYNDKNQLERREFNGNTERFYYSENGELIEITSTNSSNKTYDYNSFGMLTQYKEGVYQNYYYYDANKNLVNYTQQFEQEYYSNNDVMPFADGGSVIITTYNYLVNDVSKASIELLAVISKNRNYGNSSTFYYYGHERLGSGNALYHTSLNGTVAFTIYTNSSGKLTNISDKYYYKDFGSSNVTGFSFNGEFMDNVGLMHLRNRTYLPAYAMFLQLDDYTGTLDNITSQNRKIFANNNPYRYYDKTGNNAESNKVEALVNNNDNMGYKINYQSAISNSKGNEQPDDSGDEPISMYSSQSSAAKNAVSYSIAELLLLIFLGVMSLAQVLQQIAEGLLEVICPVGTVAVLVDETIDLSKVHSSTYQSNSATADAGTLDRPSLPGADSLDDALDKLKNDLTSSANAAGLGGILAAIFANIKYKTNRDTLNTTERHHIVPRRQGYDEPRLVLKWVHIVVDSYSENSPNIVVIYKNLHHTLHHYPVIKDAYNEVIKAIFRQFYGPMKNVISTPLHKAQVTTKLLNIKVFLRTLSGGINRIFGGRG